jgi:hypothetical protein
VEVTSRVNQVSRFSRTHIGGIEREERNVPLVNIEKIAKALRMTIEERFHGV